MVILLVTGACHEHVNTWHDDTISCEEVSTASVAGIRSANVGSAVELHTRGYDTVLVSPQDGTVGHFPLWWEDPFEDRGSEDGQFAMTWEDYFAMPYGMGRFMLNTLAIPISAAVNPPVPFMGSDGITSKQALAYDHDAEWLSSGGTATPPDILEVGSVPPEAD